MRPAWERALSHDKIIPPLRARRGAGVVDQERLLSACPSERWDRGFESHPLRQFLHIRKSRKNIQGRILAWNNGCFLKEWRDEQLGQVQAHLFRDGDGQHLGRGNGQAIVQAEHQKRP